MGVDHLETALEWTLSCTGIIDEHLGSLKLLPYFLLCVSFLLVHLSFVASIFKIINFVIIVTCIIFSDLI